MKFEKSRGQAIDNNKMVRVKRMNHIVEVVSIQSATNGLIRYRSYQKLIMCLRTRERLKNTN